MSKTPADFGNERMKRLMQAMADMMESHATQGRLVALSLEGMRSTIEGTNSRLDQIDARMGRVEHEVSGMRSELVLMSNRIEDMFSRTLNTNIRLDEMEDAEPPAGAVGP